MESSKPSVRRVLAGDVGLPLSIISQFLQPPVAQVVAVEPTGTFGAIASSVPAGVEPVSLPSLGDITEILSRRAIDNDANSLQLSLQSVGVSARRRTTKAGQSDKREMRTQRRRLQSPYQMNGPSASSNLHSLKDSSSKQALAVGFSRIRAAAKSSNSAANSAAVKNAR
mmetsp:Transcript_20816/g.37706  ORF Transcript_20816/g.37706 Transcript_20816/m.37706 type:complete len:169 (-) Transcript_20816:293-799(-)